jgi:hypothetical protein
MMVDSIFVPVLAQVALTFLIWVWMYVDRLTLIRRQRIDVQELADNERADALLKPVDNTSDNFTNQFEMPILFYVAAFTISAIGATDVLYFRLAFAFVALRAVHSIIHCTYNRVMHRFLAYLASCIPLIAIWIRLGATILRS